MRINYDFQDLEVFLALMETGAFHLAAERLNLSQSAITRRIHKLEDALDSRLFDRTTRAVRPTLAAKRLQARAEAILDGAKDATRAMRDESAAFGYQRNSIVTLAILPSLAAALLPLALRRFRQDGASGRVRILDGNANDVAETVAAGEADFGISWVPVLEPATTFEPLFEDRIVLALPPGHPLAARAQIGWEDVMSEPIIVPVRGTGNRLLIDEAIAKSGRPIGWTFEVGRATTALELVSAGVGVALVPRSARFYTVAQRLAMRPMVDPDIARPVGLLSRAGARDSPQTAALKAALRQTAGRVADDLSDAGIPK